MNSICAPSVLIGPFVVGEKPPPLEYQFLNSAGVPINLTGYTAKFYLKRVNDSAAPVEQNATISDAAAGKVSFTWLSNSLSLPGQYHAEFWVGNGTNRFASHLIRFTVRGAVGGPPTI